MRDRTVTCQKLDGHSREKDRLNVSRGRLLFSASGSLTLFYMVLSHCFICVKGLLTLIGTNTKARPTPRSCLAKIANVRVHGISKQYALSTCRHSKST